MAERHEQINRVRPLFSSINNRQKRGSVLWAIAGFGFIVAVCVIAFTSLLVSGLRLGSDGLGFLADAYIWRVAWFSLLQAGLSAIFSVALAIPVARAISRQGNFYGRAWVLKLFALPLALPALVVVLSVVAVWGKAGWVNGFLHGIGVNADLNIYGLTGILLAHILFNMPLCVRLLLTHLDRVPGESWRLSAQLGLRAGVIFRHIEWPVMRAHLPGIWGLVFMLCLTSFTVVLVLGGGPAATTIEVAIYQALRFDFDPVRAVFLSLLQICVTALILLVAHRMIMPVAEMPSLNRPSQRVDGKTLNACLIDGGIILLGVGFVLLPLLALVLSGLAADMSRLVSDALFWQSLATSMVIAIIAAILAVGLSFALANGELALAKVGGFWASLWKRGFQLAAALILVMPPIVLGAGWLVILGAGGDRPWFLAMLVAIINALMAIPFVTRILTPALASSAARHDRLCQALGMRGLNRLRLVEIKVLARPLAMAMAFAMALSLGDLGAVAMFGGDGFSTLPYLLLQKMGSYRTHDAGGLALLLAALCLGLVFIAEHFSHGRNRDVRIRDGRAKNGRT